MKNKEDTFPETIYSADLALINGTHFTRREVDVMACLLSARGTSKIASFLSIAPKTVVNHIRNIMIKVECNTREGIIDFLEKSHKISILRKHYSNLLLHAAFKKSLKEISKLNREENATYKIVCWTDREDQKELILQLETHLKLVGLVTSIKFQENNNSFLSLFAGFSNEGRVICALPRGEAEKLQKEFSRKKIMSTQQQSLHPILLIFLEEENYKRVSESLLDVDYVDLTEQNNYYFSFFEILKKLLPHVNLEKITKDFKEQYEQTHGSSEILFSHGKVKKVDLNQENATFDSLKSTSFLVRKWFFPIILLISLIIFGIRYLFDNISSTYYTQNSQGTKMCSMRSDLVLPAKSSRLNRPELLTQIDNKFKEKDGIQTVALVGIGGVGKTTLARQYAQQQKAGVIWEINAETKESLINSYESLAHTLSKTEEDKRILREILKIKNYKERKEKIISFVKNQLRTLPNWFLIFDNLENFSDIEKYFPYNAEAWGRGKIIITTKNANVQHNSHVTSIIHIGELSSSEKLELFIEIMTNREENKFTAAQKVQARQFLDQIPPFPLDVSIAAHYLKATHASYPKYLENLSQHHKDFESMQENLLKNASEYNNTRYSIISISLKQLIEAHKDFEDLLLFISMLDSQNIPRALLDIFKSDLIVDKFVYDLKKYSLINIKTIDPYSFPTLSMHRSTQKIALDYLKKTIKFDKARELLQSMTYVLMDYINDAIDKRECSKMDLLIRHSNVFLSHTDLLTREQRELVSGELGCIYLYKGHFIKAKQLLEECLLSLDQHSNPLRYARLLLCSGMSNRELGNYKLARNFLEESYSIYKKFPKEKNGLARALANLGNVHRNLGNYEKAKNLLEQSLIIYRQYVPKNSREMALGLAYLGIVYNRIGDYKQAMNLLNQSMNLYKTHFPDNYGVMAWILAHLGNEHRNLGDYERAKELLEQSLTLYKKQCVENDTGLAKTLVYLGLLEKELGNYTRAKKLLGQSLILYTKYGLENHGGVAWTLAHLGNIESELGNYREAKRLLEKSLRLSQEHLGEDHVEIAWTLAHLGIINGKLNNYREAKNILEKSLIKYKKYLNEDHLKIAWVFLHLGIVSMNLEDVEKAKDFLERSLITYEKHYGQDHIKTAPIFENLGKIYLLEGHLEEAENAFKRTLRIFQQYNHPKSYMTLENLAELYLKKCTFESNKKHIKETQFFKLQAINELKQALEIVKSHFPEDSPHLIRIQSKIKKLGQK